MKRNLLYLLLLTLALNIGLPPVAATDSGETVEFVVKDLKVIFKNNPENETVSAQLYLRGGALNIKEKEQGIEPFIFSSVALRDQKYADKKWEKIFQGTGAGLGAVSTRDFTIIALRCTRQYFDQLWEVYGDFVTKTAFHDELVEVQRHRMLTDIRQLEDRPDGHIREIAEQFFYRNHPYQFNPNGIEETISKIDIRQMQRYLEDNLEKSRLLLVVVGNLDIEDLKDKIEETLGKLPKGKYKPVYPPMVEHTSPDFKLVERDLSTNYMLGLFSAPRLNHPDYYAMTIAVSILHARLYDEIRTKRNLSYAPNAFLGTSFANFGGIYATSSKPHTTIKIMLSEIKKLKEEPVDENDLKNRINLYLTHYYLENETNASQGRFLAQFELSGLGWREGGRLVDNLRKVTPADVQRVANLYLRNIQFCYLGDVTLVNKELFKTLP